MKAPPRKTGPLDHLAGIAGLGLVIQMPEAGAPRLLAANAAFCDLAGIAGDDTTSIRLAELLGSSLNELQACCQQCLADSRPADVTVNLLNPTGPRRLHLIALPAQPGLDKSDLVLIGSDVTSSEAIRYLDGVLTTMRDVLWSVQIQTNQLTYISRSVETLLGVTPAALLSDSAQWGQLVHADDKDRVDATWRAVARGEPLDVQYRMIRPDGRLIWVHDRGTLVVSRDGQPQRVDGITQDVTMLREAETKAQEVELRYRTIVENQLELICRYKPDLTLIFCNEAYAKLYGKTPSQMIGSSLADYVDAQELADINSVVDRLKDGATISHNEQPKVLPNGKVYWYSWSDVAIYDATGQIQEIQGVGRDITERRQMEHDLHASEHRLRLAIESIPDAFALYDADDRLVLCNSLYIDYEICPPGLSPLGRTFEEIARFMANSPVAPIAARQDPGKWLEDRLERHRNPPAEPVEVQVLTGRWLRVSERRTADGGYVGIWSDITRLKNAETRLLSAIAAFNEGFVLYDKDEKVVLFNQRFLDLYPRLASVVRVGATFEEILREGIRNGQFNDIGDDAEAWLAEELRRAREPGSSVVERHLADDRWVMVSRSALIGGGFVGLVTDLTDVIARRAELERTQQKLRHQTQSLTQLAEQLRSARIAAETANQAKSRFLAHMSHELRTPLNAILGFADVIRQNMFGEVSPSRYRDYAQYIHESGSHLLEMINDVLDLSKIEAGKFELKIEALDAPAIAQSGSKLVAGMAKENGVNLILDGDMCPIIHGDSRAVKQIIINLLSNGVKFTHKGGYVTLQINEVANLGAEIVVTDTGIGMSKEDVAKAMDPFGQIDGTLARRHRGTGLGLPLVKNLAEMQKGFISIDSAPSRGTRVSVFLPNPAQLTAGSPTEKDLQAHFRSKPPSSAAQ
jgi:PAS domain S-box-containing protein